MCELTEAAMLSLLEVAGHLQQVEEGELTGLQLRTLMWARCALAALYGIRIDEAAEGLAVTGEGRPAG